MKIAVMGARCVVPCITAAYEDSPNCKRELGFVSVTFQKPLLILFELWKWLTFEIRA